MSVEIVRTLTQAEFDAFAALSGDDNAIHVDPAFSAATKFGRTVAHGAFLRLILHELAMRLAPGARMIEEAVLFPAPTFAGEPVRFRAERTEGEALRIRLTATRVADAVETCRIDAAFTEGAP